MVKNGLFSFSYYQFTLTCVELNTTITRKLTDFDWFRTQLIKLFPTLYIPPLPQSKFFQKNSIEKMEKRMYYMQKFIDSLIKTKLIRSSQIFSDFIQLPKEEFKKIKPNYEKMTTPKSLTELTTVEGIINVTINPYLDTKGNSIQNDIYKKDSLFTKLKFSIKELMAEMEIMSKKFNEVSKVFNLLSNCYKTSTSIENDKLNVCFSHLSTLMDNWSKGYDNQRMFFNVEIKNYFKYMQRELTEFNSVVYEFKNARSTYMDCKGSKSQNDKDKDIVAKYYGFYMNRACDEYERLTKYQYKRLRKHFEKMESRKSDFIEDYAYFIRLVCFDI